MAKKTNNATKEKITIIAPAQYKSLYCDVKINRLLKPKLKLLDAEIEREIKSRKRMIKMLKANEFMHEYLAEEEKLKDFINTTRIIKNVLVYDTYQTKKNTTIFNSEDIIN